MNNIINNDANCKNDAKNNENKNRNEKNMKTITKIEIILQYFCANKINHHRN